MRELRIVLRLEMPPMTTPEQIQKGIRNEMDSLRERFIVRENRQLNGFRLLQVGIETVETWSVNNSDILYTDLPPPKID